MSIHETNRKSYVTQIRKLTAMKPNTKSRPNSADVAICSMNGMNKAVYNCGISIAGRVRKPNF